MRLSFLAVAVLGGCSLAAHATVTYTYTGADFTFAQGDYTEANSIDGSLTFATVLAPNLSFVSYNLTDYSFTDGVQTFTPQKQTYQYARLSTDSSGDITAWDISFEDTYPVEMQIANYTFLGRRYAGDFTQSGAGSNALNTIAGTFKLDSNSTVTPEPSSFALLGTGLLSVAGVLRRRFV